jgi:hypothetical protein
MTDYSEQIARIQAKLPQAKQADKDLEVFGASFHQYKLNPPATLDEVLAFEQKYNVTLPDCYRAFLLNVGNGGAAPYYGLYQLGAGAKDILHEDAETYLKGACVISPRMTDDYWGNVFAEAFDEDDISYEDFCAVRNVAFAGILSIGSQGCNCLHALILTENYRGRIVYLDLDSDDRKPRFTFENNFLDWYERWLDEVITRQLTGEWFVSFGFCKGGTEDVLLAEFFTSADFDNKQDCLHGLLNKQRLKRETIVQLEKCISEQPAHFKTLTQIICKFDYSRTKPYLTALAETDLLAFFQTLNWYAATKCDEWLPLIEEKGQTIQNAETFQFCGYVLEKIKRPFGHFLMPYTQHENENIREKAYYLFRFVNNKADFFDTLVAGLNETNPRNVMFAIQGLSKVKDARLLPYYKKIAQNFQDSKDGVLMNLGWSLKKYGLTTESILSLDLTQPPKKWYEFWK